MGCPRKITKDKKLNKDNNSKISIKLKNNRIKKKKKNRRQPNQCRLQWNNLIIKTFHNTY